MYSLVWMKDVLTKAGLKVVESAGWETRGHGDASTTQFIICHHTASPSTETVPNMLKLLVSGRSDLKGPLCNLALGRDGTFYLVAAGKAWHAGKGTWKGFTDGNGTAIGIEAENDGLKEPWSKVQKDAYAKGIAALLKHINKDENMCCGHKEYATPKGRKADPNFDMNEFRNEVATYLKEMK